MTSDKSSEERFEAYCKVKPKPIYIGEARDAWQAQEAYWSERVKELEERLSNCHRTIKRCEWYLDKYRESLEEMQTIGSTTFGEVDIILATESLLKSTN